MSIDVVILPDMPRSLSRDAERAFRDRLCRIAARQFATLGYAGVTLRALAQELGCSRMTPYRYFADKGEILAAIRAQAFGRLADINEKIAARTPHPVARIEALGRAYVRFAADEPDSYRLMYETGPGTRSDTEILRHPEVARQLSRSVRPLRSAVREAVDRGLIRGDADTVTHVCWAALHGAIALHLEEKLHMGRALDTITDCMIDVLLRGLRAEPPERVN